MKRILPRYITQGSYLPRRAYKPYAPSKFGVAIYAHDVGSKLMSYANHLTFKWIINIKDKKNIIQQLSEVSIHCKELE